jgi:hypothetical protein
MQVQQGRVNFATLAELPEGAPIMMAHFLSTINPLLSYLIPVQPIASLAISVVPEWDLILVKPRGIILSLPLGERLVPINLLDMCQYSWAVR